MSNTSYCLLRLCQTQASPKVIKRVHRIIESLGLEGTYQGHLVQPPYKEQGHLELDQLLGWTLVHSNICRAAGAYHTEEVLFTL